MADNPTLPAFLATTAAQFDRFGDSALHPQAAAAFRACAQILRTYPGAEPAPDGDVFDAETVERNAAHWADEAAQLADADAAPDEYAETERCGWRVQPSGLHGDQLVRVSDDDGISFYLDAAMYDALDDDAFETVCAAKQKAALLGLPTDRPLPAFDVEPDQECAAEEALAAFRTLKAQQAQRLAAQGGDGPTFAFEPEDAAPAEPTVSELFLNERLVD